MILSALRFFFFFMALEREKKEAWGAGLGSQLLRFIEYFLISDDLGSQIARGNYVTVFFFFFSDKLY